MFSDPFSAVMALVILSFVGLLAVFLRIWRELDAVRRSLAEARETLQYLAVDIAQQNRDLIVMIRGLRSGEQGAAPGNDSLGELLEKGIPNLVGSGKSDPAVRNVPPLALGNAKEDEFFRRLETSPDKNTPS